MKKILIIIGFILATFALLVAIFYPNIEIKIKEEQVRTELQKRIPFSSEFVPDTPIKRLNKPINVLIDDADVKFLEDGRISVYAHFNIVRENDSIKGKANLISGVLFYDPESTFYPYSPNSAFYLSNPEISNFQIEEMEISQSTKDETNNNIEAVKEKAASVKNRFRSFLKEKVSEDIVNDLENKESEIKRKMVNHINEKKEVYVEKIKDLVKEQVAKLVNRFPVYTLDATDLKQKAAMMVLKEIYVEKEEMTLVLSLTKFLSTLTLYIIALSLYILVFFVVLRNPQIIGELFKFGL